MSDTPIFDQLLAGTEHQPACAVCGDFALHLSANLDLAIEAWAGAFDSLGPGLGSLFRDLLIDAKPELVEIALGGPR